MWAVLMPPSILALAAAMLLPLCGAAAAPSAQLTLTHSVPAERVRCDTPLPMPISHFLEFLARPRRAAATATRTAITNFLAALDLSRASSWRGSRSRTVLVHI